MSRESARYRVHLAVRYGVAAEFVREYAENLSNGGLFIAGASGLEPLQEVGVEIELPGFGKFRLKCQVAHVITEEAGAKYGHKPGAGLAILAGPRGYKDALMRYLQRLGRRADHLVLCGHQGISKVLGDAGYKVQRAPAPDGLAATIADSDAPVIAVVVDQQQGAAYAAAANAAGAGPELVLTMASAAAADSLLADLDERL
jgi:hypothetical protein